MRRWLYGGIAGAGLIIAALVAYAFFNLNSIVAANRDRILKLTSDALGRPVAVGDVHASLGWGVSVEITGLEVGDDPAFSQLPFLTANQVSLRLKFFPLVFGRARFRQLDIIEPEIRILRNARGELNLGTLGNAREKNVERKASSSSALARLAINRFQIDNANIIYNDLAQSAMPIKVHGLDLTFANFCGTAPFDVEMKFGFLGRGNVEVSGQVGPLLERGHFLLKQVPADLKIALGPMLVEKLRRLTDVGAKIPLALEIPDPVSASATLKGRFDDLAFEVHADLTQDRIAYAPRFAKPAGVAMKIAASGTRRPGMIRIAAAEVKLATLDLDATEIAIHPPSIAAQVDSNAFGLAEIVALVPAVAPYGVSGNGEVHGVVKFGAGGPGFNGVVKLTGVGLKSPPHKLPAITNLSSTIRCLGTGARLEPTTLTLGSSHLDVNGNLASLAPLSADYTVRADTLRLVELHPGRQPGEIMNQVTVTGRAAGALDEPVLSARIVSPDGMVNNVNYTQFDLDAEYRSGRIQAHPLIADVFGGSIVVNVNVTTGDSPSFGIGMKLRSIDLEPALRSQHISAANWVHGLLTGNVSMTGRGARWPAIKPTLYGSGEMQLTNGKLVGVNIVALAINGVARAPGQLLDAAFMSSHSGMLADPDTELTNASLSFVLSGPRITTHDLAVQSQFYGITGDGWFDMDKNIDMDSDIQLTFGLRVAIPVWVKGQLPAVIVLPDIPKLTERIAMGAIRAPGRIIRGGMNAVGSIFGGGSSESPTSSSGEQPSSIPNPFKALKSLIP